MIGDPNVTVLAPMVAMLRGENTDVIEGQLDREGALHVAVALAGNLVAARQAMGLDPVATAERLWRTAKAPQNQAGSLSAAHSWARRRFLDR